MEATDNATHLQTHDAEGVEDLGRVVARVNVVIAVKDERTVSIHPAWPPGPWNLALRKGELVLQLARMQEDVVGS